MLYFLKGYTHICKCIELFGHMLKKLTFGVASREGNWGPQEGGHFSLYTFHLLFEFDFFHYVYILTI